MFATFATGSFFYDDVEPDVAIASSTAHNRAMAAFAARTTARLFGL